MVQLDGSHHDWFEGRRAKCVLMVMVDDATNRKALYERLLYALQGYEDPWLERVRDEKKRREFKLIPAEELA